jgi:hypothetical protein
VLEEDSGCAHIGGRVGEVVFVVVDLRKLSVLVKSKFEAARARSWFLVVEAKDGGGSEVG